MRNAVVGVLALVIGMLVADVRPARADLDDKAAEKIERLNEAALRAIAAKKLAAARKTLYQAEGLGIGLWTTKNKLLAETYVALGALEIIERGDRDVAAGYFRQAQRLDASVGPSDRRIARDDVEQLFGQARSAFHCKEPLSCRAGQNPVEPDAPYRIVGAMDCRVPEQVMEGATFFVRCAWYPDLPVISATLYYQPGGSERYTAVKMWGGAQGWWTGSVPATSVTSVNGKTMRFYVLGNNAAGKPVVAYGREDGPNTLMIVPPAKCDCEPIVPRGYPESLSRQ
jgi:hypothetical protein